MKVESIILILVSLTLIFMGVSKPLVAMENLSYADGYRDGKRAAIQDIYQDDPYFLASTKVFGNRLLACILERPLTIPYYRLCQIKNKPGKYQKGYIHGYEKKLNEAWNERCLHKTRVNTTTSASIISFFLIIIVLKAMHI